MSLTLHHGDCLEVMKDISDASVDLIICDLPYGCLAGGEKPIKKRFINGKDTGTTLAHTGFGGCDWDIKIDLTKFWEQVKRIRRNDHSPTIHFCTTKFGAELITSNPSEFRYDLVWDKQRGVSFLSANKMPMRSHEMIYIFSKAGAFYTRIDEDAPGKGQRTDGSSNTPRKDKACVKSVIQIKKVGLKTQSHPTQKPEELYRWLLERYCPAGGTVLDPTFGSGNAVFTAYDLGLHAIGIEKDTAFFTKASDKIEHV